MQTLGPGEVIRVARQLGLTTPIPEYLSVAIGAAEGTLAEMTSAYAAFPNQGVRMTPALVLDVTDREGDVLEQYRPEPHNALRADTAFIMTELMHGVVEHGTGAAARNLKWPLGGKTGTTDDYADAWFIGFDPDITVGVWLGHDEKKPLGPGETGTTAALPMWMDFMREYLDLYHPDREKTDPPRFEPPGNIVFMPVNRHTGEPTLADAEGAIAEAFISGTQPTRQ
jgi:penicillin-binding protein 1A